MTAKGDKDARKEKEHWEKQGERFLNSIEYLSSLTVKKKVKKLMNRWIYVRVTNGRCAIIINDNDIILGSCLFLKWSIGQHIAKLKHYLEEKGILEEWTEMGEISLKRGK